MDVQVRIRLYEAKIRLVTDIVPQRAHALAAAAAAAHAADGIQSTYTGTLARDVSKPKPESPLTALIGSRLPYARVEHFGGPIRSSRKMYIRGRAISSRGRYLLRTSASGGRAGFAELLPPAASGRRPPPSVPGRFVVSRSGIVATAFEVQHPRKLYLDRAVRVYPDAFAAFFRRLLP